MYRIVLAPDRDWRIETDGIVRILCAPDKFKGTLTAEEAAEAMARGVRAARPDAEAIVMPVGDGGEGTLDAILRCQPDFARGWTCPADVLGPSGSTVRSRWGALTPDVAYIELADAAGLMLVPKEHRDPMRATTFGVGQLMRIAHDSGRVNQIIGIGGSATVDGGTGIAQALGFRFIDESGATIEKPMCGGRLRSIARIEPPEELLRFKSLRVACDVTNPLCGPNGAARVYGPQKGASARQVRELEAGLRHLTTIAGGDPDASGAGAAGGAAYGLATLLGAHLKRGIDLVLDFTGLDGECGGVDLVLTGEGRLDAQSLCGKAAIGVANRVRRGHDVPVIAIVGSTGPGWEKCLSRDRHDGLLTEVVSLSERFTPHAARTRTVALIEQVAREIVASRR